MRLLVLTAYNAVVPGITTITSAGFLTGAAATRSTATSPAVSVLCVPVLNKFKKSPKG